MFKKEKRDAGEEKVRDEKQFKKETKMGAVFVVIAVIVIAVQLILNSCVKEEKKPVASVQPTSGIVTIEKTVSTTALSAVRDTEKTIGISEDNYETGKQRISIKNVNEEVMGLLDIDNKTFRKKIYDFSREYGYEYAKAVVYYGQTIINHNDNTVRASFYFDNGEEDINEAVKFDIVYARNSKTYRFVMW